MTQKDHILLVERKVLEAEVRAWRAELRITQIIAGLTDAMNAEWPIQLRELSELQAEIDIFASKSYQGAGVNAVFNEFDDWRESSNKRAKKYLELSEAIADYLAVDPEPVKAAPVLRIVRKDGLAPHSS